MFNCLNDVRFRFYEKTFVCRPIRFGVMLSLALHVCV